MRAIFFLLLIIIVFVVVRFVMQRIEQIAHDKKSEQNQTAQENDKADLDEPEADNQAGYQKTVVCAYCETHLLESDAITTATSKGKLHFCSQAHLENFVEKK